MLLRVIDFETTGMPPEAAICEIGYCDVETHPVVRDHPALREDHPDGFTPVIIGEPRGMLVDPRRPMPPEARAIHHISDADLAGKPGIETGLITLNHPSVDVFVAHNMAFEREFFTGGQKSWICTLKVARRLWPECPSHTNQCLRYFLGIELDDDLAMPPPSGGARCLCDGAHPCRGYQGRRGARGPDLLVGEPVTAAARDVRQAQGAGLVEPARRLSRLDRSQVGHGCRHQVHRQALARTAAPNGSEGMMGAVDLKEPRWHWRNCRRVSIALEFRIWPFLSMGGLRNDDVYGGDMWAWFGPFAIGLRYDHGNCSDPSISGKGALSETETYERALRYEGCAR